MKQQQKSLHRVESFDTLATSFVTSACSAPSMRTDYGLARAMNSFVVPNELNPIATIKDRKNANYIEDLGEQHDLLRTELDEAIAAFEDITLARDTNKNVVLEAMLNRKFLEANNALARCSREYSCFLNDTKELKEMPKMSREELARRFTARKEQEKANREDENAPSMKQRMGHIEDQIVDLELEKEYLTERLGQSAALAEHSAQMEHLIENLERERLVILKQFTSSERLRGQHENDVDQLYEDLAYQEHLNRQTQLDNAKITVDLEATTRANEMMKHDLESEREKAEELSQQLQNTRNDIRNHQRQLSFTKITATTLEGDNKKLRQEINELNEMCGLARDELEDLQEQNVQMGLERKKMQEMREMQKETNAYLRSEFGEMHGLAVGHMKRSAQLQLEAAQSDSVITSLQSQTKAYKTEIANLYGYAEKLKAELAAMKARAMRRDSVVGSSTEGEAQRSASA
ncbi:hypothetical protein CB0940_00120 [Cercospora beticola]|uniref:Uncharacterized protein n=1 Tax=Cercospora beticola TaxID=122368 RepID=A0A2G5I8R5_CERBT|nr:hypothetical protein CB0940_00120 [Cercospora beticola]PIB01256.1 hypothetical protein CB0940_00120 [Cercospora beticola]WPA95523.1 hypothetical protein RHO25_000124 [Cercospora beticola]